MTRVLVLGASGFIGNPLIEALLRLGGRIRAIARSPWQGPTGDQLEYIQADIGEIRDWAPLLEGCVACVHLVHTTLPATANRDPRLDISQNLLPIIPLAEALASTNVRLIYVSSGGTVYGETGGMPVDETSLTNPVSIYGATKLAIEKYIGAFRTSRGLRATILRVSNPYGPRQQVNRGQGVVGSFLTKAMAGETIEIWGDGLTVRDYIYVDDVVRAILASLDEMRAASPIYNVGSGRGYSLNEVVREIEYVLGKQVKVCHLAPRSFDIATNILDCSRSSLELGWTAIVPFREGLTLTAAALRGDRLVTGNPVAM